MLKNNLFSRINILKYFWLLLLSFLLFLPLNYFIEYYTHHLVFISLLVFIGLTNRILYMIASVIVSIATVFIIHIEYNWGGGFVEDRIAVMLESPNYEMIEYIKAYVSSLDILLLVYFIILIIFIFIKVKLFQVRLLKYLSIVGILCIGLFINYKQVAIMTNPSAYITFGAINGINSFYNNQGHKYMTYDIENENIQCSDKFDKILIVIGEAVRKDHMSLYGYHRKTTPFFDSLELVKFDAIAPTNQTRSAVPMLITHGSVNNPQNIFRKHSLIEELKKCGYETYWISNQAKIGKHDTDITAIARKADNMHFVNKEINKVSTFDELIYDYMREIDIKNNKKQAFFIHMIGSHQYYNTRTPKNHKPFGMKNIIDEYDNTIHYTDMVLSKIFDLFDKEKLLFAYTSDHAEVVSEGKVGHGFIPSYKDEYILPLIVWSKSLNKFKNLKQNTINTESFNYLIRYLVGIDKEVKISYSTKVIDVNLKNIVDFNRLEYYNGKN